MYISVSLNNPYHVVTEYLSTFISSPTFGHQSVGKAVKVFFNISGAILFLR